MKIIELVEGEVINIEDKLTKKVRSEFRDKLSKIADDLPRAFKQQKDQENWLSDELKRIKEIPNKEFGKAELMKVRPLFKDRVGGFQITDAIVSNMHRLEWIRDGEEYDNSATGETKEEFELAKRYFSENHEKLIQVLQKQIDELRKLAEEARKLKWYAPWERYSMYGYDLHQYKRDLESLKQFKKALKL